MKHENIVYSLSIKDIQTVAEQELERKLSDVELKDIVDIIGEKINWYNVIADAIEERIS